MTSFYNNSKGSSRVTCKSCGKNYQKAKGKHSRTKKQYDLRSSNSIQKYGSQLYFKLSQPSPQLDEFDEYLLKRDRKHTKKIKYLIDEVQELKARLKNCQIYIESVGSQNKALKKSLYNLGTSRISNNIAQKKNDYAFSKSRILNEQQIQSKIRKIKQQDRKKAEAKIKQFPNNGNRNTIQISSDEAQQNIKKYLPSQQFKSSNSKKSSQENGKYGISHNQQSWQQSKNQSNCKSNELLNMYYDGNQYQLITPNQKATKGLNHTMEEFQFREQKTLKYSTSMTPNQFQTKIDGWTDQLDHLVLQESKANSRQTKTFLKNRIFQISQKIREFQDQNLIADQTQNDYKQSYY